jgi:Cyanobacterial and plant NDH-1 subunit O
MGETPSKINEKNMAATIKKGALVRVVTENLENSLEALASDRRLPSYMFTSKAEVLDIKDDYALVKFYVPTPSVWLKLEQLEPV